ncbi:MAG TPA: hypothetical protein VK194_05390 [Candidatus Deferrimicrobium sp.]|nr:hypothetical protein [Candidatus Deferrimicrobium sp.]
MPDPATFEQRLGLSLQRLSDLAARDVDVSALVDGLEATASTHHQEPSRLANLTRQLSRPQWRIAFVAVLLLGAVVAYAIVATGRRPALPPASVIGAEVLRQTWLADKPDDLLFPGETGPRRLALVIDPDGASITVSASAIPRVAATTTASGADLLDLRAMSGTDVIVGGQALHACPIGAVGTYRWTLSDDGATLTLAPVTEVCPARSAVLARSWARSLGADSRGGRGVVDAFTPGFLATLPNGTYAASRSSDAIEIWASDERIGLLAWKDPQGFIDPCDQAKGRYDIPPTTVAFVAYFAQNAGFEVISSDPMRIDGRPAVMLVVRAQSTVRCQTGFLSEFQPKAESSDLSWHLDPGIIDRLALVEVDDHLVMLEVLPLQPAAETTVLQSVRFIDRVPPDG